MSIHSRSLSLLLTALVFTSALYLTGYLQGERDINTSETGSRIGVTAPDVIALYDTDGDKVEDALEEQVANEFQDGLKVGTIETVITFYEPYEPDLLQALMTQGCIIEREWTIIKAIGASVPVDSLQKIASYPQIELVWKVYQAKHHLHNSRAVITADPPTLSGAGYSEIDGSGISIAIMDTGIDGDHVAFPDGKIIAFKDFIYGNDDLDPTDGMNAVDYYFHGTACAGVAAGTGGSSQYVGVAPGAYLVGIAVGGSAYAFLDGLEWAIANKERDFNKDGTPDGVDILSVSLGYDGIIPYIDNACTSVVDAGIVFVTSQGNNGPNGRCGSPASAPAVISVGAINDNKNLADFSSKGPGAGGVTKPEVCAPGVNVVSPYPGNQFFQFSGTSASCPFFAGAVALLLQLDPLTTPAEVKQTFTSTAIDKGPSGPDNSWGWGIPDTVEALKLHPDISGLTISTGAPLLDEDQLVTVTLQTRGTGINGYHWDFRGVGIEDIETDTPSVTFSYQWQGLYNMRAWITSDYGHGDEISQEFHVVNVEPVAHATSFPSGSALEDELVEFDGSGSWDTATDLEHLQYDWDFGDDNTSKGASVNHTYTDAGVYYTFLTVTDNDAAYDQEVITLTVNNVPPTAVISGELRTIEDTPVMLLGEGSYDTPSDMSTLNYSWAGPEGREAFGPSASFTFQTAGEYTIALTVTDNNGDLDTTDVAVQVNNTAPYVVVGDDVDALEDSIVTFEGEGFDTPSDSPLLEYMWDFGDGDESDWSDSPEATHIYTGEGTYTATLFAIDDNDVVSTPDINSSLEVEIFNVAPSADLVANPTSAPEDTPITITFDKTTDTESDRSDLTFTIDFYDGEDSSGPFNYRSARMEHVYTDQGKYQISLVIEDDDGDTDRAHAAVNIYNVDPTAVATADVKIIKEGESIYFDASASTDTTSDQATLTYDWTFGDRGISNEMTPAHTYEKAGTYTVALTVTDDNGAEAHNYLTIEVEERESLSSDVGQAFTSPSLSNWGLVLYLIIFLVIFLVIVLLFVQRARLKTIEYVEERERMGSPEYMEPSFTDGYTEGQIRHIPEAGPPLPPPLPPGGPDLPQVKVLPPTEPTEAKDRALPSKDGEKLLLLPSQDTGPDGPIDVVGTTKPVEAKEEKPTEIDDVGEFL